MIDLIDDDPDGVRDFDEPEPDWANCPMLPRSDMFALIERQKALGGRAVNLFRNALKGQPRSDLLDHYLVPHLYHPGSHYIYTTPDPDRIKFKNWRPDLIFRSVNKFRGGEAVHYIFSSAEENWSSQPSRLVGILSIREGRFHCTHERFLLYP